MLLTLFGGPRGAEARATREAPDLPRSPDSNPTPGQERTRELRLNPHHRGCGQLFFFFFYYFYLFFYLAVLRLGCSRRGICLQHANSQL